MCSYANPPSTWHWQWRLPAPAEISRYPNVVAFGEIGLAGEVRVVPGIERRLVEAARLGFTHALRVLPPEGMTLTQVADIHDALVAALILSSG